MLGHGALGQFALGQGSGDQETNVVLENAAGIGIAGLAPSISTGANVQVPAATVAVQGFAPSVASGSSIAVPAADIAVQAFAPSVGTATEIEVPAATISITAFPPSITTVIPEPTQGSGYGGGGSTTFVESSAERRRLDEKIRRAVQRAKDEEKEIARAYDMALGIVIEEEVGAAAQAPQGLTPEERERLIFEIEIRILELLRLQRWEEEAIVLLLTA